jgi:hypothetical protein
MFARSYGSWEAWHDRQWFEDHPGRIIRLRFPTDGDPPGNDAVIVYDIGAFPGGRYRGVRLRIPIRIDRHDSRVRRWLEGAPHDDADLSAAVLVAVEHIGGMKMVAMVTEHFDRIGMRVPDWLKGKE